MLDVFEVACKDTTALPSRCCHIAIALPSRLRSKPVRDRRARTRPVSGGNAPARDWVVRCGWSEVKLSVESTQSLMLSSRPDATYTVIERAKLTWHWHFLR